MGEMSDRTYDFTALGRVLGGIRGQLFRMIISDFPNIPDHQLCYKEFAHCYEFIDGKSVPNYNKYFLDLAIKFMRGSIGDDYEEQIKDATKGYLFALPLGAVEELSSGKVGPIISEAFRTKATRVVGGRRYGRNVPEGTKISKFGTKGRAWIIQKKQYRYLVDTVEGGYWVFREKNLSMDRDFLRDFEKDLRKGFRRETGSMGLTATLALEATEDRRQDEEIAVATKAIGHLVDRKTKKKFGVEFKKDGNLIYVPWEEKEDN